MRIIKEPTLQHFAARFPQAAEWLEAWRKNIRAASWKNLVDVRRVYPSADAVKVESGRTVVIFNVCGNKYRLIVALHYRSGIVYTLRFLTHAEYSKDQWKSEL